MAGPYDLEYEERSYTERLPFGLGSDNLFVASWPDLALIGGGSLLSRAGVRHALGHRMMSWGGAGKGKGAKGLGRALAAKGTVNQKIQGVTNYLQRAQGLRGMYGPKPQFQVYDDMRKGWLGKGSTIHTTRQAAVNSMSADLPAGFRAPSSAVEQVIYKAGNRYTALDAKGRKVRVTKAHVKSLMDPYNANAMNLTRRATTGARMAYVGGMAKGLGKGLLGLTFFTIGLDVTKMVGEAAIDWKPRRDSGSPYEFGHVFYDPRGAFTQRQRAIAAIHDSQLTTRAALGGEAAFMHT